METKTEQQTLNIASQAASQSQFSTDVRKTSIPQAVSKSRPAPSLPRLKVLMTWTPWKLSPPPKLENLIGRGKRGVSMLESDSTAERVARISTPEEKEMPGVSDPYIREQLEKRRNDLRTVISSSSRAVPADAFVELLSEVDSALERMDVELACPGKGSNLHAGHGAHPRLEGRRTL